MISEAPPALYSGRPPQFALLLMSLLSPPITPNLLSPGDALFEEMLPALPASLTPAAVEDEHSSLHNTLLHSSYALTLRNLLALGLRSARAVHIQHRTRCCSHWASHLDNAQLSILGSQSCVHRTVDGDSYFCLVTQVKRWA